MITAAPTIERGLVSNVSVSTRPLGYESEDEIGIDARLDLWRRYNVRANLTGALLASSNGVVLILEGTQRAIAGFHRHAKADPWYDTVQLLAESVCLKRRFAARPLAYVGPSRWVDLALEGHSLTEMVTPSASDAGFLIDLVLSFVGEVY